MKLQIHGEEKKNRAWELLALNMARMKGEEEYGEVDHVSISSLI